MSSTIYPFAKPLYIMSKPAGAHCNLACDYCYYLEKQKLYNRGESHIMSDALTEKFVKEYIQSQTMPQVLFTWHGGEPMMRPLSFYKKVVRWQKAYADGRQISNCIQTNGTLLTEEWCRWLHDEQWLVGVSIDGPREMHDAYRKNQRGGVSWHKVMDGIRLLNRFHVEWNAMAVVNSITAKHPLEFYRFFRDELKCQYLQFTPVVERIMTHSDGRHLAHLLDEECPMAPFSVSPSEWGTFLNAVFDEWVRNDVGEMFVQTFEATLANMMGVTPGVCSLSKWCGHAGVMEYNGDVYSCDHFVFPEYRLGNIMKDTLIEMLYGEKQNAFGKMKTEGLPRQCRECDFKDLCNGECPRNRFLKTADGEFGLNYLCAGYRQFFQHAVPILEAIKQELQEGRPATNQV